MNEGLKHRYKKYLDGTLPLMALTEEEWTEIRQHKQQQQQHVEKPSIGIMPKWLWVEHRVKAIVVKFYEQIQDDPTKLELSTELADELHDHIAYLETRKNNAQPEKDSVSSPTGAVLYPFGDPGHIQQP